MRRRLTLAVLLALLLIAAAALFLWYWKVLQWQESTDNAYLVGNLVSVSAQTTGTVVWIGAEENDSVAAGDELVRLGGGDDRQILEQRKEQLALAVQEIVALRAQVARRRAELEERTITRRLADEEYQRRKRLHARKMLSDEELDAARTRAQETAGALETARHALQEARVRAGDQAIGAHPAVLAAASAVRSAWRTWRKSSVLCPVDGEVARRRVQLGQRIEAGAPLFSIAERSSAWVEANFKETQLRHMRPGQPVRSGGS